LHVVQQPLGCQLDTCNVLLGVLDLHHGKATGGMARAS
jgi:hypothetical protein